MGLTFTWKRHHERHMHHPALFNPSPYRGHLHGSPFGRRDRDRAPAVGAAPVLARTCPMHPRDRPSA